MVLSFSSSLIKLEITFGLKETSGFNIKWYLERFLILLIILLWADPKPIFSLTAIYSMFRLTKTYSKNFEEVLSIKYNFFSTVLFSVYYGDIA